MARFRNSRFKTIIISSCLIGGLFPLFSVIAVILDLHSRVLPPYPANLTLYRSPANPTVIVVDVTNTRNTWISGISLLVECEKTIELIEALRNNRVISTVPDSFIIDIPDTLKPGTSVWR